MSELERAVHEIEAGVRHGPAEFTRALERLHELVEHDRVEIDDLRCIGDRVDVAYRGVGRGRESGVPEAVTAASR